MAPVGWSTVSDQSQDETGGAYRVTAGVNSVAPEGSGVGGNGVVDLFSVAGWAPMYLFGNGEPGFWLDPSDFTTMFQDSAGTTPVTAVEQPVGLILDKKTGAYGIALTSGSNGDYYSTPNAAANQITGDIDIRWYGRLNSVAPAAYAVLVDKVGAAGNYGYTLSQDTAGSGKLVFAYSTDGTSVKPATSSATLASVSIATSSLVWLRATLAVASGDVKFYYSPDGTTWTQLGTTQTTAAGAIFASTYAVSIAYRPSGTQYPNALWTYRAQILNGIGGTVAVDFNPARYAGGSTFTAATGEVWTVNGNARIVIAGTPYYQSTAGVRPVLSARVNLLTKTEDFSNAAWTKSFLNIDATLYTAPNGTLTANKIFPTAVSDNHYAYQSISATSGVSYTAQINAKEGEYRYLTLQTYNGSAFAGTIVDLRTGTKTQNGTGHTVTIAAAANGFYLVTVAFTAAATTTNYMYGGPSDVATSAIPYTWTGDAAKGIYIWGADLRLSDQATGLIPTYQRVNTSTDYDTAGFPLYLSGNGTQWMQCAAQDYTGVSNVTAWAGVRVLTNIVGFICELSATTVSNNGAFFLAHSPSNDAKHAIDVRGTAENQRAYSTYSAPITNTISAALTTINPSAVNSALSMTVNINGVVNAGAAQTNNISTGNFGNYPAYLFARAGTAFFLTGQIFQLIARGSTVASNAAQIASAEAYTDSKTKAY